MTAAVPRGYEGTDLDAARRFGVLLWLAGFVSTLPMLALYPPTKALGAGAGWTIVTLLILGGAAAAARLHRHPHLVGYRWLMVTSLGSVAGIAIVQALGGGRDASFHELLVLPMVGVAMVHPPRATALFFAAVSGAMALPELYDPNGTYLGEVASQLGVWAALTGIFSMLMTGVRRQRVGLEADARRDALTGLQNRRAFEEALESAAVAAARTGEALTLVVLDLDAFKQINDRFGHPEGDACLVAVARVLDSGVRGADTTFRWGGDEFAALLRGTAAIEAAEVCDRLVEQLSVAHPLPDGSRLRMTFGMAQFSTGTSPAKLMAAADEDLLAGKGRLQPPLPLGL